MSRLHRLITAVAVTLLLAACGQAGDNPVAPAGPSLDSGVLIGGGNKTEPDSTTSSGTGTTQGETTSSGIPIAGGN